MPIKIQMNKNNLLILVVSIILLFLVFYLLSPINSENDAVDEPSLQLVTIVFRHGARAPDQTYKNDPHTINEQYWPDGLGQLLLKGIEEMYTLGTLYRERYKHFIPKYKVEEVSVNSSDFDRTLMSASSLLAGWFPPEDDQVWNEQLLWQPIPIHSVPVENDYTLTFGGPCPYLLSEFIKLQKDYKANHTKEDSWLWDYLAENTGEDSLSFIDATKIYLTLSIEKDLGLVLPEWTEKVYPKHLKYLAETTMEFTFWTKHLQRLFGGPMLKEILHQLKEKIEGNNVDKKLFLYSSHDITIHALAVALGYEVLDFFMPKYGASMIFELHKLNNQYYVKTYYQNDTIQTEPHLLNPPCCPNPCLFEKLYNATEFMRSINIEEHCQLR